MAIVGLLIRWSRARILPGARVTDRVTDRTTDRAADGTRVVHS